MHTKNHSFRNVNMSLICTQKIIHSVMWACLLYAHKRSFIPQCAHVSYIHTKDQSFRKVNMSPICTQKNHSFRNVNMSPICTQKIIHSVMWNMSEHVSYMHTNDHSFRNVNMCLICTQKIIHSVMCTCLLYAHKMIIHTCLLYAHKRSFIP